MSPGARLGVDLDRLGADAALLATVGAGLGDRLAEVVALRHRAERLGGVDDGTLVELPDRLRQDLDALGHLQEAAGAAWQGLVAVGARLAHVLDEAGATGGAVAEPDDGDRPDGWVENGEVERALVAARAGATRIDTELGRLDGGGSDGELVLIGGR
ncbi:hypothetical protein [Gordonia sp. (in: high G+C Gram-positive bacteria)]|uniref:hypothetical protein n=1 Tax=Gordonia sp. (in: high G+C Gram-positive bacteria) TaxID=84139 RepID=UPI0039E5C664